MTGARRKKFDDLIYILRLPRGAGSWFEIACQGNRVTIAHYVHGVIVDTSFRKPVTVSLGEFTWEFVKLFPQYGERLADIIADEEVW